MKQLQAKALSVIFSPKPDDFTEQAATAISDPADRAKRCCFSTTNFERASLRPLSVNWEEQRTATRAT